MSVLQESNKLDAMFALKRLDEYCTKCLNSKFTAFWILVLHLSKRYCKLDKIYALKSLDELNESKTYCKVDVMFALKSLQ